MFDISFVISTRNKYRYLSEVLGRLIEDKSVREEIVVVDGGSTDGAAEYLESLHRSGKIESYLSEPDWGQAHAANKGLLMARGRFIKIMTDDDLIHLPTVRAAASFMDEEKDIDMVAGNIADATVAGPPTAVVREAHQERFELWRRGELKAFWFGDQGLLLRRSSLPIIGMWHTGVHCIDVELSLRLTALRQAKLAWHTGVMACTLVNEDSLSRNEGHRKAMRNDYHKLLEFYGMPVTRTTAWQRAMRKVLMAKESAKGWVKSRLIPRERQGVDGPPERAQDIVLADAYSFIEGWLEEQNSRYPGTFLYGDK
jgi:glycosyltransferase involved in cell wall biosynthesis